MVTRSMSLQRREISMSGSPFSDANLIAPVIQDLQISEFQTAVWQDSRDVPDESSPASASSIPPAYDTQHSKDALQAEDANEFGAYDDHRLLTGTIEAKESDVKDEIMGVQETGAICFPSSASSSNFSTTPRRPHYSRLYATGRPPQSPSSSKQVPLTKVQKDICKTVLDLLQEVVRQVHLPTSLDMLESCATTCYAHRIPLSSLLQEANIAGHTPFYWVIIRWKALPMGSGNRDYGRELLDHLISLAAPLVPSTVADLRLGCLHLGFEGNGANAVFQQLRKNPLVNAPSASDAILLEPILLSTSGPRWDMSGSASNEGLVPSTFEDDVQVLELPGALDRFIVKLQLKSFLRRMSVSRSVAVEFIARGRAWILQLFVIPSDNYLSSVVREETMIHVNTLRSLIRRSKFKDSKRNESEFSEGTWAVSLGLLGGSSPVTHGLSARLVIPPAKISSDTDFEVESREKDLTEAHLQQRDAAQAGARHQCKARNRDSLVQPCSQCDKAHKQKLSYEDVSEDQDADVSSYLLRLLSRLVSTKPTIQDLEARGSVDLKLQHFPFEDVSKRLRLLTPPLPIYPSVTSFDGAKMKGRDDETNQTLGKEARDRACALDLLASFDDCEEAFDGCLHVDADGSLNAILEVQLPSKRP